MFKTLVKIKIKLRPTVLIKNDAINTHSNICTYIMDETSSHPLHDFKPLFSNNVYAS